MKKNYIIPSIESVAFHAGSICDVSPGAGGRSIGGGTLDSGGEVPSGDLIEPL